MTPTDTAGLDLLTAKTILAAQGVPGKGQPVAPWESQPEAFRARMMEQAIAIRLAHAKAGVQSVPVVALSAMRDVVEAAKDCFKQWNADLDNPDRAILREALAQLEITVWGPLSSPAISQVAIQAYEAAREPAGDVAEMVERLRNPTNPEYKFVSRAEIIAALIRIAAERDAAHKAGMEEAAGIAEAQIKMFSSTTYATMQPQSSMGERFACTVIADAIRKASEDRT